MRRRAELRAYLIDDGRDLNGGGLTIEELPACDQYTIQGDLFSRAIREGGEVPVPLEDAVKTMAVIDAVFLAAETGRRQSPGGGAARGECDSLKPVCCGRGRSAGLLLCTRQAIGPGGGPARPGSYGRATLPGSVRR